MPTSFTEAEYLIAQAITTDLSQGNLPRGVVRLRELKDDMYAAIPDKQRQSRGITWVVQRIADLLFEVCDHQEQASQFARSLYAYLPADDMLVGVAIFLMAAIGKTNLSEALDFFTAAGSSPGWVVREFAAAGLRKIIKPNREPILPWLQNNAQDKDPNLRRLVSEALRPVSENRWINSEPNYSLSVLRLMFCETHPYPRTSVGNNLSDLSRRNPELILEIVVELVTSGDPNSYWIAYRASRNLIKLNPQRVMDALRVGEYHYKDRNYVRNQ